MCLARIEFESEKEKDGVANARPARRVIQGSSRTLIATPVSSMPAGVQFPVYGRGSDQFQVVLQNPNGRRRRSSSTSSSCSSSSSSSSSCSSSSSSSGESKEEESEDDKEKDKKKKRKSRSGTIKYKYPSAYARRPSNRLNVGYYRDQAAVRPLTPADIKYLQREHPYSLDNIQPINLSRASMGGKGKIKKSKKDKKDKEDKKEKDDGNDKKDKKDKKKKDKKKKDKEPDTTQDIDWANQGATAGNSTAGDGGWGADANATSTTPAAGNWANDGAGDGWGKTDGNSWDKTATTTTGDWGKKDTKKDSDDPWGTSDNFYNKDKKKPPKPDVVDGDWSGLGRKQKADNYSGNSKKKDKKDKDDKLAYANGKNGSKKPDGDWGTNDPGPPDPDWGGDGKYADKSVWHVDYDNDKQGKHDGWAEEKTESSDDDKRKKKKKSNGGGGWDTGNDDDDDDKKDDKGDGGWGGDDDDIRKNNDWATGGKRKKGNDGNKDQGGKGKKGAKGNKTDDEKDAGDDDKKGGKPAGKTEKGQLSKKVDTVTHQHHHHHHHAEYGHRHHHHHHASARDQRKSELKIVQGKIAKLKEEEKKLSGSSPVDSVHSPKSFDPPKPSPEVKVPRLNVPTHQPGCTCHPKSQAKPGASIITCTTCYIRQQTPNRFCQDGTGEWFKLAPDVTRANIKNHPGVFEDGEGKFWKPISARKVPAHVVKSKIVKVSEDYTSSSDDEKARNHGKHGHRDWDRPAYRSGRPRKFSDFVKGFTRPSSPRSFRSKATYSSTRRGPMHREENFSRPPFRWFKDWMDIHGPRYWRSPDERRTRKHYYDSDEDRYDGHGRRGYRSGRDHPGLDGRARYGRADGA